MGIGSVGLTGLVFGVSCSWLVVGNGLDFHWNYLNGGTYVASAEKCIHIRTLDRN